MMGMDGGRRLFEQDVIKPKDIGSTLARFGAYFRHYWFGGVIAITLIFIGTWTQVVSPEYIGQAVDCYLFPRDPASCWYTTIEPNATVEAKVARLRWFGYPWLNCILHRLERVP